MRKREIKQKLRDAKVEILKDSQLIFSHVHTTPMKVKKGGQVPRYEGGKFILDREMVENCTIDQLADTLWDLAGEKIEGREYGKKTTQEKAIEQLQKKLDEEDHYIELAPCYTCQYAIRDVGYREGYSDAHEEAKKFRERIEASGQRDEDKAGRRIRRATI